MIKEILVAAILATGALANADTFYCMGVGKYATAFPAQTISLQWPNNSQKVLSDTITTATVPGTRILADIDKSNSDGTAYFEITVLNMNSKGEVTGNYAKGSIKDEVSYGEQSGKDSIGSSAITCLPVPLSK